MKRNYIIDIKRNWILGIILFLLVICILYLWNTNEGFFDTEVAAQYRGCPNPIFTRNSAGVCIAPPLAKADNTCDDPKLLANDHGYCVPKIKPSNGPLRIDNTCPDPDQSSVYDRFAQGVWADMTQSKNKDNVCSYEQQTAPTNITYKPYVYKGNSNVCLPDCPLNFIPYVNDFTLCIAQECYNTIDLSSNILTSWRQNCGPMYKTQINFTSTLNSVSSVTASINNQFLLAQSNINTLSNGIYATTMNDVSNVSSRNKFYPNIISNYYNIQNLKSQTNQKYNSMLATKSNFDSNYYTFQCDLYTQM